jgi:hypothetical protein
MADRDPPPSKSPGQRRREERLAEALRANLRRRKQATEARSNRADGPTINKPNQAGSPGDKT